jgi:membrane fusion protein
MQQNSSIYRREALQAQTIAQHGPAMLLPSNRMYLISAFLFAWVTAIAWFLLHYSFAEKVTVTGYVLSDQPSIAIGPKENVGIVSDIYVQNGAHVRQGSALLRITRPNHVLLGSIATDEQLQLLNQQLALLALNQAQRSTELAEQRNHLAEQREVARQQKQALDQQAAILAKRIELSLTQVSKLKDLFSKQLLAQDALTNAQQGLLSLQQQQSQLNLQISDLTARLSQLDAQRSQLQQQLMQLSTQSKLNQLPVKQQIGQIQAQQAYTIYAPRDGVISNLHAQLGDDVARFNVLMKLSPEQQSFSAVMAIPTNAAGFIAEQQRVSLRLDAFAYQKYGSIDATIANIPRTITMPNESLTHTISFTQPMFMVEAKILQAYVKAKGDKFQLKEGMTFQADVTLSERSLLEWLLSPLYSVKGSL